MSANRLISAVSMSKFGMDLVVLTDHKEILRMQEDLDNDPDSRWTSKEKERVLKNLSEMLPPANNYFYEHEDEAVIENVIWRQFLDRCVFLAVLDADITKQPLQIHFPELVKKIDPRVLISADIKPSALSEITTMNFV